MLVACSRATSRFLHFLVSEWHLPMISVKSVTVSQQAESSCHSYSTLYLQPTCLWRQSQGGSFCLNLSRSCYYVSKSVEFSLSLEALVPRESGKCAFHRLRLCNPGMPTKEEVWIESANPLASAIRILVLCILICRSHQPKIPGDTEKKFCSLPCFINIVLLEHSDVHLFICWLWFLLRAKWLSNHDRDNTASQAANIIQLPFF